MMTVYLTWQDSETRRWHTVGELTHDNKQYRFRYTKGVKNSSNFKPFGRLSDIEKSYFSDELFPLFENRILSKSRPEYKDYLRWMDINEGILNPLEILSRSGGERATDGMQIYPAPEKGANGRYESFFFIHGIRHLPREIEGLINQVKVGDILYPMLDLANPYDKFAVSLRTGDPAFMVGYCPRYLARDAHKLTSETNDFNIKVAKVNLDAPAQMRILCKMDSEWPNNFSSCLDDECEPLAGTLG